MTDFTIHVGDVREQIAKIPDGSIQTCITSPPYWGLRDYGTDGQLGLEETPEQYVENMVSVFREVRRTLRDDGTLWLNLGDSYAGSSGSGGATDKQATNAGSFHNGGPRFGAGLKTKDLVGIPWRVAFALQADGWYLRSDIIWAKPNPMPESVRDRPTKSHEYIFLLTKSARYYFDQDAVREKMAPASAARYGYAFGGAKNEHLLATDQQHTRPIGNRVVTNGRNIRDVWTITTKPFPGAHFAVFPPEIPSRCIRAGTSERGCCAKCGAPLVRIVERVAYTPPTVPDGTRNVDESRGDRKRKLDGKSAAWRETAASARTTGWRPSCDCDAGTTACTVLDPFTGSGTTGIVASKLGRHFVGVELNPEYAEMARRRIMDAPMSLFSA